MITNYLPCSSTGDANGGNITVNISNIEIGVPNAEDFIVFVEALFLQAAVDMQMKGSVVRTLSIIKFIRLIGNGIARRSFFRRSVNCHWRCYSSGYPL